MIKIIFANNTNNLDYLYETLADILLSVETSSIIYDTSEQDTSNKEDKK